MEQGRYMINNDSFPRFVNVDEGETQDEPDLKTKYETQGNKWVPQQNFPRIENVNASMVVKV